MTNEVDRALNCAEIWAEFHLHYTALVRGSMNCTTVTILCSVWNFFFITKSNMSSSFDDAKEPGFRRESDPCR